MAEAIYHLVLGLLLGLSWLKPSIFNADMLTMVCTVALTEIVLQVISLIAHATYHDYKLKHPKSYKVYFWPALLFTVVYVTYLFVRLHLFSLLGVLVFILLLGRAFTMLLMLYGDIDKPIPERKLSVLMTTMILFSFLGYFRLIPAPHLSVGSLENTGLYQALKNNLTSAQPELLLQMIIPASCLFFIYIGISSPELLREIKSILFDDT